MAFNTGHQEFAAARAFVSMANCNPRPAPTSPSASPARTSQNLLSPWEQSLLSTSTTLQSGLLDRYCLRLPLWPSLSCHGPLTPSVITPPNLQIDGFVCTTTASILPRRGLPSSFPPPWFTQARTCIVASGAVRRRDVISCNKQSS